MQSKHIQDDPIRLSVIVPCYNEKNTLFQSVVNLLGIQDDKLKLEVIIVDDKSTDGSRDIAQELISKYPEVKFVAHDINYGKGAALRTGFQHASCDYVAVHDADLEYDPNDLKQLLEPLAQGKADVVYGSRYLKRGTRRVIYFWHSLMNRGLTFVSNMFTDLDLTDMETCYKLFRREIINSITIEEDRFGFEPEITAKVAQSGCRVYEMPISYFGRTYAEGKKINWKDGLRALYCIFHYSAPSTILPLQMLLYFFIGGFSAVANVVLFGMLISLNVTLIVATLISFYIAAFINYILCIKLLFRHNTRWSISKEIVYYLILVSIISIIDYLLTAAFMSLDFSPITSKCIAALLGFVLNFCGRKYIIFVTNMGKQWLR